MADETTHPTERAPALTAEEWAETAFEIDCGYHRVFVDLIPAGHGVPAFLDITSDSPDRDVRPTVVGMHGIAALCLYGTPEGFTRGDVAMLRWGVHDNLPDPPDGSLGHLRRRVLDLADRIEALLPPLPPTGSPEDER